MERQPVPQDSPLTAQEIRALTAPVLLEVAAELPEPIYDQLEAYLRLLYRWNQRMNLTAVRDPREMAHPHLAECLRCACRVPGTARTLLDYGSGAGLPGIPIQMVRPDLAVTLAESQGKKAGFLREATRELGLRAEVWHGRVEAMAPERRFDVVALRAVDKMQEALADAQHRLAPGGCCLVLTSEGEAAAVERAMTGMRWEMERIPATRQRVLLTGRLG
jgi:16S rRNA (guanine527-N7)-methyltransferase